MIASGNEASQICISRSELKWSEGGPGTIGLGVAEMDFGTAPVIAEAVHEALSASAHGYISAARAMATSVACAAWHDSEYGWPVDPGLIRLVPDAATALFRVIGDFIPPDWPVIVPIPAYPKFFAIADCLGRRTSTQPLLAEAGRYSLNLERLGAELKRSGPCLVLLSNPHNPTGYVASRGELSSIYNLVARHGGAVISDEVFAPLTGAGASHVPFASLGSGEGGPPIFTISSSAKAWNISGLKCAQVILPHPGFADRWDASELLRSASSSTSTLGAVAAEAAYAHGSDWLAAVKRYMAGSLDLVGRFARGLVASGAYVAPEAFYLAWISLPSGTLAEDVAADAFLLNASGVVVAGGQRFGSPGDRHAFRINFAASHEDLAEALNRMTQVLSDRRSGVRLPTGP